MNMDQHQVRNSSSPFAVRSNRKGRKSSSNIIARIDYGSFAIWTCIALMVIPYLFDIKSSLYILKKYIGNEYHLLLSFFFCSLIYFGFQFGRRIGKRMATDDRELIPYINHKLIAYIAYAIIGFQFLIIIPSVIAYASGGFLAAREFASIQGLGIVLRFWIVPTCILAYTGASKSTTIRILILAGIISLVRALIYSERLAVIEFAIVAAICAKPLGVRMRLSQLLALGVAVGMAFGALQNIRLAQQDASNMRRVDSFISSTFIGTLIFYYADTQNKAYLAADGVLKYPKNFAFEAFYTPFSGDIEKDLSPFLAENDANLQYTYFALNNPGGPGSDFSDFGVVFGTLFAIAKFIFFGIVCSRQYHNRKNGLISIAIFPFIFISILEYPRFNYIELPFAAYSIVAAICLAVFLRSRARKSMMRAYRRRAAQISRSDKRVGMVAAR